jgi:hypothetical protein
MRRTLILFVSFALVLIGIGAWVFFGVLHREAPPAASSPPPVRDAGPVAEQPADAGSPDPAPAVEVLDVQGPVDIRQPERDWQPAAAGARLSADDIIRTGQGGTTRLQVDERSIIQLQDRSELAVKVIRDTVHVFGLIRGKLKVDYSENGERTLKIESDETGAVAEARAGQFTAMSTRGTFAVATTTGDVKLTARQVSVPIAAGTMSMVHTDQAPSKPEPIPTAILLKVALPGSRVQRAAHILVRGRTNPGAQVQINGADAPVDPQGRFRMRVELREGKNPLLVVSQDVAGNLQQRDFGPIIVDPSAPIEKLDIQWGQGD